MHDINKMTFVGKEPWHGLGTQLPRNARFDELAELAGIFTAEERGLSIENSSERVTDRKALVRGDDGRYLAQSSAMATRSCSSPRLFERWSRLAQSRRCRWRPLVDGLHGKKEKPAASAARKHWQLVRQFAAELGLSPAARTRVGAPDTKAADDAEEVAMFGGAIVQCLNPPRD